MSTKIELNINASSLPNSACLLSWHRTVVDGYLDKLHSVKMVYGIAFHKYEHIMYQTGDMALAKIEGLASFRQDKVSRKNDPDWYRDEGHFLYTCFDVWTNFALLDFDYQIILKPDGKPATEVTFSIPFYEDDIIIVNVCGTIDKIGKIKHGCYAVGDWKTTAAWDYKEYLRNYDMKSQLRFYILALKLMHKFFPESQLGQIGAGQVGGFIDGVFLKDKPYELSVKRSDTFQFNDLDLFEKSLLKRIKQFSEAIHDGTVTLKEGILLNTCERKYFKCPFFPVCRANNPAIESIMLQRDFKQEKYDPLHRDIV